MLPRAWMVILTVVLAFGSTVQASEASKDADALAREGVELRRIGKDAAALPKFEQAYSKSKNAKHLAQTGLCLQAVGRWSEAEEALSTALQDSAHAWIKTNRDILKESLEVAKQHVGGLEVTGSPVGAPVSIDGRNIGTLPLATPLRLSEGPLVLEVRAPAYRPERRELIVQGGQFRRIQIDLQPQAAALASSKPETLPVEGSATTISEKSSPLDQEETRQTPWLWIGAGSVVVAAGLAAFFLLSSGSDNPAVDGMGRL